MRLIKLGSYSPVTASATGLNAASLTGAGPFTPTTTAMPDSLAHLVTLTVAVSNYSGTNVTLTGTDADGHVQTETLAGPNANTVTSTKHFLTVTSISVSASLGGNGMSVGYAAESVTPTIPLERMSIVAANHDVDVSGTINFSLYETFDNVFVLTTDSLDWGLYATAWNAAKTATTVGQGSVGAAGARVRVNTVTNGATLTWRVSNPTQQMG